MTKVRAKQRARTFPTGGGEMGALVRAHDWSATPLGPIETWPPALRAATNLCLHSAFPTLLYWGPDFRAIYNDAFIELLGRRHPRLGEPGEKIWPELWPTLVPRFAQVLATGEGASMHDRQMMIVRRGERVESWWNSSFTPVFDEDGAVRGVLSQPREITDFVLQRQFDSLMIALDERLMAADTTAAKMDAALALIGEHLGVKRTGYGEIEGGMLRIARCWAVEGMPDIRGDYPLGAFGAEVSKSLRAGMPVSIEDNRADPRTSDPDTLRIYERIGLRSGIVAPILDHGRYVGGVFVQHDAPRVWTAHQVALVEAAAARLWQALVRSRAEAALRDSEERHRLIFEQAHDIIFTADLDQRITACNPAAAEAIGEPSEQLIGRAIADFVDADDFARTTDMLRQKLARGGTTRYEVQVIGKQGRRMAWEINSTLALDRDGRPVGLHAIARDVTERRAFEERQQLLIHELNHRVKNSLALVQGLAFQSFRPGRDPDRSQADFHARLAALAAAHDLLTRDGWEGATLGELVAGATAPHAAGERIAMSGPRVRVTSKAAVSIVMALHELATNAVKYGALSVPDGRIAIDWDRADGRLRFRWRESGGPPVAAPVRRGIGIRMIERALAGDLGGTATIDFDPEGLACLIDAPLETAA